jgi:hypothetical protein
MVPRSAILGEECADGKAQITHPIKNIRQRNEPTGVPQLANNSLHSMPPSHRSLDKSELGRSPLSADGIARLPYKLDIRTR